MNYYYSYYSYSPNFQNFDTNKSMIIFKFSFNSKLKSIKSDWNYEMDAFG